MKNNVPISNQNNDGLGLVWFEEKKLEFVSRIRKIKKEIYK